MEVTYTLTPKDLWAFQQFHARRKPVMRLFIGMGLSIIVFSWLSSLWTNIETLLIWRHAYGRIPKFGHLYWSSQFSSLLSSLFLTALVIYIFWGARFLYLKQRDTQMHQKRVTMRLYSDAVFITTPEQNNLLNWHNIHEITGNRRYLYFYTSPITAVIVPRRVFTDGGVAFETTARTFKSDPHNAISLPSAGDVWPPPPMRQNTSLAPAAEEEPDPTGTLEIAYVTRRADAWRSAIHTFVALPTTILRASVPLIVVTFFIAFNNHSGLRGYLLALLIALIVTIMLILNQTRIQLTARYPNHDSTRACVSKIRPDAFVDISPSGRTMVAWQSIQTMMLVRGDLFLRRKDGLGSYFIPRSAFQSPADAQTALDAMRRCQQQAGIIG